MINGAEFNRNVGKHTLEELAPYEEQHVAWSQDGTRILAAAPTVEDLYRLTKEKGITDYVAGFVPSFTATELGGALFFEQLRAEEEEM